MGRRRKIGRRTIFCGGGGQLVTVPSHVTAKLRGQEEDRSELASPGGKGWARTPNGVHEKGSQIEPKKGEKRLVLLIQYFVNHSIRRGAQRV